MIDKKLIATLIPLVAVVIALAEYLYDRTEPRYQSPTFWAGLITTIALLILVQVLRYTGKSKRRAPSKPDYSATSIIRRTNDRGSD